MAPESSVLFHSSQNEIYRRDYSAPTKICDDPYFVQFQGPNIP